MAQRNLEFNHFAFAVQRARYKAIGYYYNSQLNSSEIKKYGIVALLFTVCSAISLISAVAYLITSADGALYNVLALVWLVTIASGCVLAVFSHGPRWVSFVCLSCVILYGLLHIVSSYLLMIAMGAMSAGGMAYILLRGLSVCMIFASGCLMSITVFPKRPSWAVWTKWWS